VCIVTQFMSNCNINDVFGNAQIFIVGGNLDFSVRIAIEFIGLSDTGESSCGFATKTDTNLVEAFDIAKILVPDEVKLMC
jgi:hypothetical protein